MLTVHVRRLLTALLAISFSVLIVGCPTTPPPGEGEGEGEAEGEFIPAPQGFAPGIKVVVNDVLFPEDGRPEVNFTLEDEDGNTIALSELTDARFILARLETPAAGSTARYESYSTKIEDPDNVPNSGDEALQADYDSARMGGITRNGDGTFTYKFATMLPEDFDPAQSHQLAGQFRRNYFVNDEEYRFNLIHPFRPDGGELVARRDIVSTESCNKCHTRLSVHGDVRREVPLCIMCHNGQSFDAQSGNSLDMADMIHKIHRGVDLPSVQAGDPYEIVGFGNSVHDYSDVVFSQDIRNCSACHDGSASQVDVHLEQPTLAGCASCHDRTWFGDPFQTPENFTNHIAGQQVDDSLCSVCHQPSAPSVAPILEAHFTPTMSPAAPGLALDILSVVTVPVEGGNSLVIDFTAEDKNGTTINDLSELDIVAGVVAYPVPEYEVNIRENIQSGFGGPQGTLTNNGDGTHTYIFDTLLPTTDDTFAVALEGRRDFTFRGESYAQGTATNGQTLFALANGEVETRRPIIDEAKCNACHEEIRFHGDLRVGVNLCVMCHNVNGTDASQRPEEQFPPETINFKDMIHRIHSGEDLSSDYTVYGFGGVAHDFTHVRFPGMQQECSICHVDGSTDLPLSEDALSTMITQGDALVEEIQPERASCTSCHDGLLSNVHAVLATDPATQVESCAVCHGSGASFAVDVAHALAP